MKTSNVIKTLALAFFTMIAAGCSDNSKEASPVIGVEQPFLSITKTEQEVLIPYNVENAGDGTLRASTEAVWLHIASVENSVVRVLADENREEDPRTAEVILSCSGAKDAKVVVEQEGVGPKTLTFDLKILDMKSRQVVVECIPSDLEATYVATVVSKSDFDENMSLEDLAASDIEYFKSWGDSFGDEGDVNPDDEPWTKFLRKGAMKDYDITLSKPDADYVFYAYGLDKDGSVTSPKLYSVAFHTPLPEAAECTFKFTYRPGINFGRVNVYPSDIHVSYIWGVYPKAEYDALGSDKAQAVVDEIKKTMASQGGTWRDYVGYHNKYGNYRNMKDGEKFVAFAFGADITGVPTTEAMSYEFTARTLAKQECNFSFAFQDVRATTFAARITPSSDVRWVAYTLPSEYTESYNSVEDMTEVVIDTFNETLENWWEVSDKGLAHEGSQLMSSYQLQASMSLDSSTKQIVCAFGVDSDGYRVTDVAQGILTTAALGQPSSMTIDFEIGSADGATVITFKPSKMEAYFYDLIAYSEYEKYENDEALYVEAMYKYSSMMAYKMTMGEAKMTTWDLHPGSKYVAYAFGMDGDRSTPVFKKVFTVE